MINQVPCQNYETACDWEGWCYQQARLPKPGVFPVTFTIYPPTCRGTTSTPRDIQRFEVLGAQPRRNCFVWVLVMFSFSFEHLAFTRTHFLGAGDTAGLGSRTRLYPPSIYRPIHALHISRFGFSPPFGVDFQYILFVKQSACHEK